MEAGRLFHSITSARARSFFSAARPAGCFRSSTTLRLLRLRCSNFAPMPGVTDFPFITRTRSPAFDSTLITSAPWSARIWVASGPTTTEVRSTTRTSSRGPPDTPTLRCRVSSVERRGKSLEFGFGAQGKRALVVHRPQLGRLVVGRGLAADRDRADHVQRAHVARSNVADRRRAVGARKLEHEERREPAVHDEAGVAFFFGHVGLVVVVAVAVEGEGGIAKQHDRVRRHGAAPHRSSWRRLRRLWRRASRCGLAVGVVLLLADGEP